MLKKAMDTTRLDQAIEDLENAIIGIDDPETEKYQKMVSSLETLHKLRAGKNARSTELRDWIPVIGSLGGILVIVTFEAFGHTLTSKSIGFTSKLKS